MTLENHYISSNEFHTNAKLKPLLSNRQLILLKHLSDIDNKLADMYIGALVALKQEKNPHRIQQSAYSIRELLDNIGKKSFEYEGIDTTEYRLGVEVRNLKGKWDKRIRNTECYTEDNTWEGDIDVHLNKLLYSIEKFFDEFQRNRATRSESFPVIRKHLDPIGISTPAVLRAQISAEWEIHAYDEQIKYLEDLLEELKDEYVECF